ncbi:aminoacyl-tRNA hydrolase [Candidatus Falkowbacteria bacterium RIFOXYB2_FULL_47_14]|uniref:Peptidyl-tRNA hydrolase n=1 Tax=Candidatus Falkowbacteria bacterium RIFOXYA2_FULL_47_19 TaxID=1797994 RepID=A0A1F5SIF3_9BACT|nr:MAG: aminoacyl-tRNA hydrolase [Candidatus Falkowbacteria bacterium RIFOXYA2_FULL_47_19]OGF36712.1 MAG: aminoacyl-tRNA hydrolase [Candidatus Falkowbacteria bacterium RIFOXYC2_FULL_46_15]OGF42461.1 MAG: aminoacyl-tRNA hydrolase [Candidatus Falkowbacteria bacterium RIFOXYB2_FULL_47_14]
MKLIIGLGNPGEEYRKTRHNAGFIALDAFAKKEGLSWTINKKFNAATAETSGVLLVKPLTYMNNSGQSAQAVMAYYKLLPKTLGLLRRTDADLSELLTVIHDDLDIPLGEYRISVDSRSAGHRGVESIIGHLKTKNFKRIRIGIKGGKPVEMPTEKYVLGRFNAQETEIINKLITEKILTELA